MSLRQQSEVGRKSQHLDRLVIKSEECELNDCYLNNSSQAVRSKFTVFFPLQLQSAWRQTLVQQEQLYFPCYPWRSWGLRFFFFYWEPLFYPIYLPGTICKRLHTPTSRNPVQCMNAPQGERHTVARESSWKWRSQWAVSLSLQLASMLCEQ